MFIGDSSLTQQSVGVHVGPLGHIILIPSQRVFGLTPQYHVLSGEPIHTYLRNWNSRSNEHVNDVVHNGQRYYTKMLCFREFNIKKKANMKN